MKYYVIAGEASGDLHASNLVKQIKILDPKADFRCWGGDLLQQTGATLVKHYKEMSYMGFTEVLLHLPEILKNIQFCKKDILKYKPDAVILVDYPGFNLRIAGFAKQHGFRVFYYISPQVWAWKQNRVEKMKKVVDKMLVILPFEKAFYKKFDWDVEFVGHPLLDAIGGERDEGRGTEDRDEKPLIALLPGSRKQEISRILPVMLQIVPRFPNYRFMIAGAPSVPPSFYDEIIRGKDVKVVFGNTYSLLRQSGAALVTSGTATLETALIGVPQVVCYNAGVISYSIAKWLIKVKYISLVNLIAAQELVKELIQDNLNPENLVRELTIILKDENERARILKGYEAIKQQLGGTGASARAAAVIAGEL